MDAFFRHVDALVRPAEVRIPVHRDLGFTFYDDPVFLTVVMALKAQALMGRDLDQLHLKTVSRIDDRIRPPRPFHGLMGHVLLALGGLDVINDFLNVFCAALIADQKRIIRINDNNVFQADGRDQAVFAENRYIFRIKINAVCLHHVAVLVHVADGAKRCP